MVEEEVRADPVAPLGPSGKSWHVFSDFSQGSSSVHAVERVREIQLKQDLVGFRCVALAKIIFVGFVCCVV